MTKIEEFDWVMGKYAVKSFFFFLLKSRNSLFIGVSGVKISMNELIVRKFCVGRKLDRDKIRKYRISIFSRLKVFWG